MLSAFLRMLVRWYSRRSLRLAHAVGRVAGWATFLLSPTYRRRLGTHAALAGAGAAASRRAIASAGCMVSELPFLWLRPPDEPLAPHLVWHGADVIEEALARGAARGSGVVLLTPHLGAFEVAAQAYAERFGSRQPLTVLYRPPRQAWLQDVCVARRRPHLETAPSTLGGVRQMMRALRRGEVVGLLPDQVPPEGMGVWAPFFGRPAYTMTLAARLVEQTGAEVVLMYCERLPKGAGFDVHAMPMSQPLPSRRADGRDDEAHQIACAALINREMESLILKQPAQYLWGYSRYKTPRRIVPDREAA